MLFWVHESVAMSRFTCAQHVENEWVRYSGEMARWWWLRFASKPGRRGVRWMDFDETVIADEIFIVL